MNADEVGLFIAATDTPEFISPATSMLVKEGFRGGRPRLARRCAASCSSFVTALQSASNASWPILP